MIRTVSWPSDRWAPMGAARFSVQPINLMSSSPYTGTPLSLALAQAWQAEMTWNNTDLDDAFELQAFLESLDGNATRVRLFDWQRRIPKLLRPLQQQPWSDTTLWSDGTGWSDLSFVPLITYAAERGKQVLVVSGLPVSQDVLTPGDLFQIDDYLYVVTQKVRSNAGGSASVQFRPGLRTAVAAGDTLGLHEPRGVFRMVTTPVAIGRAITHGEPFTLSFVEDVP